jgi:hypothetical protein
MDEMVDAETLRREVREKYRQVALEPDASFDFYTGRPLAAPHFNASRIPPECQTN